MNSTVRIIFRAFLVVSLWGITGWAATAPVATVEPQLPVWEFERGGITSYIIGSPLMSLNLRMLPEFYRDLIRSRPKFLSESGEFISGSDAVEDYMIRRFKNQGEHSMALYLTNDQLKFVKAIMRRLALNNSSRLKQIFIPGYAGVVGEGTAWRSTFMPPLVIASSIISATSGVGIGRGPTAEELLLKTAEDEKREIVKLKHSSDFNTLMKAVGPRQLQDVIDYVRGQHAKGEPVALYSAIEKMISTIDMNSAAELVSHSLEDLSENVNTIESAHDSGGTVVAMNALGLVSLAGRAGLLERLDREGFKIGVLRNGDGEPPPTPLLTDCETTLK